MSKCKPETVEKNISTLGPPAAIQPTPLRYRCIAFTTPLVTELQATKVAENSRRNSCELILGC